MPAENTPTPAGGVIMSLFPYSRAAFDYTDGLIRAWHDVPAIVAGETIILGQLLDAAHTEALTEHEERHDAAHPSGSGVCRFCDLTITSTDDLLDQLGYSTDATLNASISAELQRRSDAETCEGCVTGRTHCTHCEGDCSECVDAADQRHLQHVSFDAESADQRGLSMIEAAIEWLIEWYGVTEDELYLANLTDMWSHIMVHANSTD